MQECSLRLLGDCGIISARAMSSARTRKRQMGCLQTDLSFVVRIGRMPVNEENEVFRVGTANIYLTT